MFTVLSFAPAIINSPTPGTVAPPAHGISGKAGTWNVSALRGCEGIAVVQACDYGEEPLRLRHFLSSFLAGYALLWAH